MSVLKKCNKCCVEKEDNEFYKNKNTCKSCYEERRSYLYHTTNKERVLNKQKQKREINKNQLRLKRKEYYEKNKDRINERRNELNKKKSEIRKANKIQEKINKQAEIDSLLDKEVLKQRLQWRRASKKYLSSVRNKIHSLIGASIWGHLKQEGISKNRRKWEKLLGYSVDELIAHLEKQFKPEMNWDNYGIYWHIDHVVPKSWFTFNDTEEEAFKKCWGLENLQPLEATLNLKKGNRFCG